MVEVVVNGNDLRIKFLGHAGVLAHLEGVAVQFSDAERELLDVLSDALVGMREATKSGGSIVGSIAAVLAVQHVCQADHEGNLDPFLHVLQACIHTGSRDGDPHEHAQPPGKSPEILHRSHPA